MVFPPHSTYSLQLLDVVLFSPLLKAYSEQLAAYLHRAQGLIPVKKSDFFSLFWASYTFSFTPDNILKAFEATGVEPPNANVVLQRFKTTTPQRDKDSELGEEGQEHTWRQLRNLFDTAVRDKAEVEAKKLDTALHHLQVENELLHHENQGLRDAMIAKGKHKLKSKALDLQQPKDEHGRAKFWSPRSVQKARDRDAVKQREDEVIQLQKKETKELKAAATLYKKKIAEEAKALRQRRRDEHKKEREAQAQRLAAARAQKRREKEAATAQKSHDRAITSKRKASRSQKSNNTKRRRVMGARSGDAAASPPPQPPPKTTTRGRHVKVPKKFE